MLDQLPRGGREAMDCGSGDADQQQHLQPQTALAKQLGVQHLCDHRCRVTHVFGNAYQCESSGQLHVCDANCGQRVYRDRYSTVCRISRRVFPSAWVAPAPCRKRSCSLADDAPADACRKRGACPDAAAFYSATAGGSQGDAMVM